MYVWKTQTSHTSHAGITKPPTNWRFEQKPQTQKRRCCKVKKEMLRRVAKRFAIIDLVWQDKEKSWFYSFSAYLFFGEEKWKQIAGRREKHIIEHARSLARTLACTHARALARWQTHMHTRALAHTDTHENSHTDIRQRPFTNTHHKREAHCRQSHARTP